MDTSAYDLVVIGSGPAGQKGAICASKFGKRVAVIDRLHMIGGVSVQKGTIPSKTLREAILYLSGYRQRTFYGKDYTVKDKISVEDLAVRVEAVRKFKTEVVRAQLKRNDVETIGGVAKFVDAHTVEVETDEGVVAVRGDRFLIACGTRPAHTATIPVDGKHVFDSDQLHLVAQIPRQLIVVGAGVIGLEYASMFSTLGIAVTVIDQRPDILDFVDRELIDALMYHMRGQKVTFRLGEKVVSVEVDAQGEARSRVIANLESGKKITADALFYAVGRQANTDLLNLGAAGVKADDRGRIRVNAHFQTEVPHIYAAGDTIGFPSLASSSMEQGRMASCHMYGEPAVISTELLPYGIYTIPEISMVGRTEQQLTDAKIRYEVGIARYGELAKAQMIGDTIGVLKLLFDPVSLRLLGVHAIGDQAAELIHIGQAVLAFGGTLKYFRDMVFNYPTLAEAYKVAALDGLNKV